MTSSAAYKDTLPDISSGEYFTPATQKERDELLTHEHCKGCYCIKVNNEANELVKACVQYQRHNITQMKYDLLKSILATLPGDN